MKVFISSLISGMEEERAVVKRAIELFRHRAVMAEDFGARPSSPQVACLAGVREADLIVLILGERYGARQASGSSATHEEYREAQGNKPILVFLHGTDPEPDQAAFIQEVSGWEQGLFRAPFSNPQELGDRVAQALHDYELANAASPLDPDGLAQRAKAMLPEVDRNYSDASLHLAVAAGPRMAVLRPAEIEAGDLAAALEQQALFGSPPLFDRRIGTNTRLDDHALVVFQEGRQGMRSEIRLWGTGDVRLILPVREVERSGLSVLIEETVAEQLAAALAFSAWLLSRVDPTEKVSHVALAARLAGQGVMGWRTRAEHAASPNSGSFDGMGREREREEPVLLSPPHMVRPALTMNTARIAEDLLVLIRRRWKDPSTSRW